MSETAIVYGPHAVRALLMRRPADLMRLMLAQDRDDARQRELHRLAQQKGVPVAVATAAELDRLSGGAAHQGALA